MAMTYACGGTTVDVQKVVDVVRAAGAAIMQVYTEDAKVTPCGGDGEGGGGGWGSLVECENDEM